MFHQAINPDSDSDHMDDDLEIGKEFVFQKKTSALLDLRFDDLSYKVRVEAKKKWWLRSNIKNTVHEKQILHGLHGSVAPGEMLALMGPSGSGKTTLLNLLSGRIPNNSTGRITYGGHAYNSDLKKMIGFVAQNDVVFPHLTVKETIEYAAYLRLPRSLSKEQKTQRVQEIISALCLERCENTMVGGLFVRGISGGERKRVCIAVEILTDPSILFFDEPTSGLDSTMALRILEIARGLSQNGMTVVMAIHQPSSRMYEKFDKLMLLSEGHCTYLGPAKHAMNYFHELGFRSLIEMNPPEFFLDLCSGYVAGIEAPEDLNGRHRRISQSGHSDHSNNESFDDNGGRQVEDPRVNSSSDDSDRSNNEGLLTEEGRKSVREYLKHAYSSKVGAEARAKINRKSTYERAQAGATWSTQFRVLAVRDFRERRYEYLNWRRFAELIAIAFISGFLWFKSSFVNDSRLGDQIGLVFFIDMLWGIFPLFEAIYVFPQERAMLAKERANNMYSLSSYFMARSLVDVPLNMIMPIIFLVITAPLAHMRFTLSVFIFRLLSIFLIVFASQGLGLLIGALVMDAKKASSLATVVLVSFILTGGRFVQNVPKFINWFKYLSFMYNGFNLLIKIEYDPDMKFDCAIHDPCYKLGLSPELQGMKLNGVLNDVLSLIAMNVLYRIFTYLALRFKKPSPPH